MALSNGTEKKTGLTILIVGAGIGGLTAAIALRKQGHHIQIFEQSRFATETGAALHLAPNANGILRRLGLFAEEFGANPIHKFTEYTAGGQLLHTLSFKEDNKRWQHPWYLAHRVELHNALKKAVSSPTPDGKPAIEIKTSSRVERVDTYNATITFSDGTQIRGDLVVGADGVHSISRASLPNCEHIKPFPSGKSAFRFLIPKQQALDDPETAALVLNTGEQSMWFDVNRRIVMYPTSNNRMLNFVLIHPDGESASETIGSDTWDQSANLEKMLKIFSSFSSAILRLLSKVEPQSVRVWKLLDMDALPRFSDNRLVLIGDAAHPFLPHQGQGAAVAIEDAAALAVVLPLETAQSEIADRLELYNEIRYTRATTIQSFSRLVGKDLKPGDKKPSMWEFQNYNFGHDEWDNSTQKLREWTWKRNPSAYWRMPIAFGPMPGPRQTHFGTARNNQRSTFTTASIKFKTSRTILETLFPPMRSGWRFSVLDTVAYATFSLTTLNKLDWLGGSGYNHIGLYIHGVEYTQEEGSVVKGVYLPVLFESLTDPIISGREELGMPKVYSSIDVYRRNTSYRARAGWEGAFWGEFLLKDLEEVLPPSPAKEHLWEEPLLTYKYLPATGPKNKGKAAEEYPVIYDVSMENQFKGTILKTYKAEKASFALDPLDWEQLPTLHHVISRLAEIPVYDIVDAKVVEGEGVPDLAAARPIV
ncbi:salicylate hydroxylase, putative [Talaromyces stipitatus ATCC 10500]|uniref:Salicylate hydroxylase, putative n=1 Tax=Talaromyces stipitatus (strain ATCC 10500 / CBS 375.48 / QM 6759 / NRRL 1006) TaxID=441959 RepID=B8LWL8_TALSN|nr:salicylate hydroxylase, putative [Talaromyces stipitatus ATCC 10500]EED24415.1 salicylate hydroxylase, putative [Talaromyces stipitatus ATCC 10500]